jgi:restriction endonuclease Mrr
MKDFIQLTKKDKTNGLFIHTGRTGKETKALADEYNIEIISGDKLCKLVLKN